MYNAVMSSNPFIKYLNGLKQKSINTDFLEKSAMYNSFYHDGTSSEQNSQCYNNQIKPIIDTKATLVLDQKLETEVEERSLRNATSETIQNVKNEASVLNDCLQGVFINNNYDDLMAKDVIKSSLINGCAIVKCFWNSELMEGAGDVGLEIIQPKNIFFDPSAKDIDSCNYIFVEREESLFNLKKRYGNNPEVLKKLNNLSPSPIEEKSNTNESPNGVFAATTAAGTDMFYNYSNNSKDDPKNMNYKVVECYLKDDTILKIPDKDADQQEKEVLFEESFKYPNGRVIIYIEDILLDDKAIDYPFGFPFEIFSPSYSPNKIYGYSQIKDIYKLQSKLNTIEQKTKKLILKAGKKTLMPQELNLQKDGVSSITIDKDIYQVPANTLSKGIAPYSFDTVDISLISALEQEKAYIESQMLATSRLNKMMVSGERPTGINSGQMVQDLNESPMVSIRETQKSYKNFMVNLSNKIITIIQFYYTDDRIFRTTTGEYIGFNRSFDVESGQPATQMTKQAYNEESGLMETIFQITSDPSIVKFRVKLSGNSIARSEAQTAELTYKILTDPNVLGLPNNYKKVLLEKLNFPNWRALLEEENKEQEELNQSKTASDIFMDKLNAADVTPKDIISAINQLPDENPILLNQKIQSINTILSYFDLLPLPINDIGVDAGFSQPSIDPTTSNIFPLEAMQ